MCIKSDFEEIFWNLQHMAKRKDLSVVIKTLSPVDCLPLPGAIYIWWNMKKMYIKSDFKAFFFKPATNGQSDKGFCWHQKFAPNGLSVPALGLYTCIKSFKMCLKSYFKEIVLKLAKNGQRDNINICPQGVVCRCPGDIHMYKSIEIYTRNRCQVNVYRTTGPLV